ncbi:alpha/beta fold hydrolase [Solicola sp. PLA-1-18]|uniref:alpha/beta fold hydrolase n=1 Tax=Solicola sp. PLA-1-18 TaxID=3380532 RepID=UPI003B7B31C0
MDVARAADPFAVREVVVHGHRRAYRMAGEGPVLLLLHGLGCDSSTWLPVLPELSRHFTVLAPDLLGHGASDKPQGDYSIAGYANGMRDLLTVLGIDRVTVVGHSFGGGVAMQFGYQFPERTERICLVAPGGLGAEVSPLIRALTVPGAALVTAAAAAAPLRPFVRGTLRALAATGSSYTRDLGEVADVYSAMCDPDGRRAIRTVTSHVVDWRGQILSMTDRAYLAQLVPLCVVWGEQDHVIPARHAFTAATHVADSEVHVFADSGHFPHKDHPERFARTLVDFVDGHAPARYHRGRWREMLKRGDRAQLSTVTASVTA